MRGRGAGGLRALCEVAVWTALLFTALPGARAQELRQGEAHITTRSDVRLSLESVPGTSATRLQLLGRAVGAGMSALRQCYHEVVEERPTVTGRMRLRVSLPETSGIAIEMVEDGPADGPLTSCIRRTIERQNVSEVTRPAAAVVVLDFTNTAAHGARETAERADQNDEVQVQTVEGRPVANGAAPGIEFSIRGADGGSEHVAEAYRVVRSQIAGMLDCRRRAGRRGRDPAGQLQLTVSMRQGQALELTVGESTVRDPAAGTCLERALERAPRAPAAGPAQLELTVRFLPL